MPANIFESGAFPNKKLTQTTSVLWTAPARLKGGIVLATLQGAGGGTIITNIYRAGGSAGGYVRRARIPILPGQQLELIIGVGVVGGIGGATYINARGGVNVNDRFLEASGGNVGASNTSSSDAHTGGGSVKVFGYNGTNMGQIAIVTAGNSTLSTDAPGMALALQYPNVLLAEMIAAGAWGGAPSASARKGGGSLYHAGGAALANRGGGGASMYGPGGNAVASGSGAPAATSYGAGAGASDIQNAGANGLIELEWWE